MTDRELVDMFMSTLTGPFYSHLLRSSSSGFTELILTGEHVERDIRSGKIQAATSDPPEAPNDITAPLPNHDETVNVVEDADNDCDLDSWIFLTIGDGLNNWKAEDTILISFSQDNSATVHYDFENPIYQTEDGSEEDCEVPEEPARLVLQEEKTIQPHEESNEI
ncbi:hypothetical protein KIW84_012866 [Lathyrus oleraceus]|uniref:Uncharacterized protein n=1 Tax=Pisum sativum TaxID=3888 RepID=A0A9D5GX91_PEA|nr:hypothetical protein KIW84_012866 [Pisum sativum]